MAIHGYFEYLVVAGAVVMALPCAADEPSFMTQAQARRLFSNEVVISHVSPKSGRAVRMEFHPDGTLSGNNSKKDDVGIWWVTERGAVCFKFDHIAEGCTLVVRNGDHLVRHKMKSGEKKGGEDWIIVQGGGLPGKQ